jgi:hypothetical protein
MSILPQLERDLSDSAIQRERRHGMQPRPAARGRTRSVRIRRLVPLPLALIVALLLITTIALAASGVIPLGSPVRPSGPLSPGVGEGLPLPGHSRLLPLRAPDPDGGPPWGIRILRTTRGLVCLQLGRVQDNQLGQLGVDGSFSDDGRFHPLPADVLPADATSGQSANATCHLPGLAISAEAVGLDRSGAPATPPDIPPQNLRDVSYGQLGPDALNVSYHANGEQHTAHVLAGVGVYLIVQRTKPGEPIRTSGGSFGVTVPGGPLPNPDGRLTSITYSFDGQLCQDSITSSVPDPCPSPPPPSPGVKPLQLCGSSPATPAATPCARSQERSLNVPVHVTPRLHGHLLVAAEISFRAPLAVTSAERGYTLVMPCHGDTIGNPIDRNVARGSIVHVEWGYPYANHCGSPPEVQILYGSGTGNGLAGLGPSGATLVGAAKIKLPPGTRPAPAPEHSRHATRRSHSH